jgi:hypothetical protein
VRLAAVVAVACVAASCRFESGSSSIDAPKLTPDAAVDASRKDVGGDYTIDPISHKAAPANTLEWSNFIAANALAISPPDGLWRMADPCCGDLVDSIGTANLMPGGTPGSQSYQHTVNGWARPGIETFDSANNYFYDSGDPTLPDLQQSSMTVMIYFGCLTQPSGVRTVLIAGGGNPSDLAEVTLDASADLQLTAGGTTSPSGTHAVDASIEPIVVKLDKTHLVQELYTPQETLTVSPYANYTTGFRGLFVGGGSHLPPAGVWLYMAAWYGSNAEMSDSDIANMFATLGF